MTSRIFRPSCRRQKRQLIHTIIKSWQLIEISQFLKVVTKREEEILLILDRGIGELMKLEIVLFISIKETSQSLKEVMRKVGEILPIQVKATEEHTKTKTVFLKIFPSMKAMMKNREETLLTLVKVTEELMKLETLPKCKTSLK
jgi:hypothetical protein